MEVTRKKRPRWRLRIQRCRNGRLTMSCVNCVGTGEGPQLWCCAPIQTPGESVSIFRKSAFCCGHRPCYAQIPSVLALSPLHAPTAVCKPIDNLAAERQPPMSQTRSISYPLSGARVVHSDLSESPLVSSIAFRIGAPSERKDECRHPTSFINSCGRSSCLLQ